jgi:small-conductance mechanosensitive channel
MKILFRFINSVIHQNSYLFFLLLPVFAVSQTKNITDSISKEPKVLAISKIPNFELKTEKLIADINALTKNKSQLQIIKKNIVVYDSLLNNKLLQLRDTVTNLNLDKLDRIEDQITIYKNKATSWIKEIDHWKNKTIPISDSLNFNFQTWKITSDSITSAKNRLLETDSTQIETLRLVKKKADDNLHKLTELKIEFLPWKDQLIHVDNSLLVSSARITEAFSLITSKRNKSLDNIWVPEYNAIWKMNVDSNTARNNPNLKNELNLKIDLIKRYIKGKSVFYYTLFFSFLFIVGLIIYLKLRYNQLYNSDIRELLKDNLVIKYPVFSAFIILNFVVFLFIDIPTELESVILLLSIIPFSVLLWKLNYDYKLLKIFLFAVSSLIFIFLPALNEQPVKLRYSLLILNTITIILLLIVQKKKDLMAKENSYWMGALPFLISLFIFLSIIAFVANIIGSVQLSLILTRTIIGTIIVFMIIKESVTLLDSFLYLILLGPLYKYSNILKEDSDLVIRFIHKVLKIIAFSLWVYVILDLLKIRKMVFTSFMDFINRPLNVGELNISLGNIISFFLILQVSVWISKFIRYFLDKEVYPRTHISAGVSSTFSLMIKYSLTFFGFLLALFGAGIELSKVAVGIGALGIGIGFGLQNIINNFVSGIILAIERPIKIGDKVKVDDIEGEVKDIGLRASQIRTWDGSDVLVPNGYLISGKLTNYTFSDNKRRLHLKVNLTADTDIKKASQVILSAASKVPKILKKPAPYLNFEGIKNGKSVIHVYAWIKDYSQGIATGNDLKIAIYDALRKDGFKISIPILDVDVQVKQNEKQKGKIQETKIKGIKPQGNP